MEMKKVACTIVFAAASLSAVMAHGVHHHAPEPAVAPAAHAAHVEAPAPAPGPASGAAALGSMVGATLLSFVAYYMQF